MAYSGIFKPINPQKYKGNVNNIIFRSGWELKFMNDLDKLTDVIEWSSEEFFIPYRDPMSGRTRRYFPDFRVKVRDKNTGKIRTIVIEIKPRSQVIGPKAQKRKTKKYITEVYTYAVNQSKWDAARKYCQAKGWDFEVVDEFQLGIA